MKMIKLLVLRNGKMVKVSPEIKSEMVYVDGECIGVVFAVSKHVYKNRRTSAIRKLLVDSIDAPSYTIKC